MIHFGLNRNIFKGLRTLNKIFDLQAIQIHLRRTFLHIFSCKRSCLEDKLWASRKVIFISCSKMFMEGRWYIMLWTYAKVNNKVRSKEPLFSKIKSDWFVFSRVSLMALLVASKKWGNEARPSENGAKITETELFRVQTKLNLDTFLAATAVSFWPRGDIWLASILTSQCKSNQGKIIYILHISFLSMLKTS